MPWESLPEGVGANPLIKRLKAMDADIYGNIYAHSGTIDGSFAVTGDLSIMGDIDLGGDIYSTNWDGSIPATLRDSTASSGFYLNGQDGEAQFMGSVFVGGLMGIYDDLYLDGGTFRSDSLAGIAGGGITIDSAYKNEIQFYTGNVNEGAAGGIYVETTEPLRMLLASPAPYDRLTESSYINIQSGNSGDTSYSKIQLVPHGLEVNVDADGLLVGTGITGQPLIQDTYSAAAPPYAFYSDNSTGLFRDSSGRLGFTVAGTARFHISTAGAFYGALATGSPQLKYTAGSVTAPTFTFYNDSNTGFYQDGADIVSWAFGGNQRSTQSIAGLSIGGGRAPHAIVDAFHSSSSWYQAAGVFYRNSATSNDHVLKVYSNIGGTDTNVWLVDTDGDAYKVSDPSLKTHIAPARSYWDDFRRLGESGGIIRHGWKGSKDGKRLTNWDAAKVREVFPNLAPRMYGTGEDSETVDGQLMVNFAALDIIAHKVLMEAQLRIEVLEGRLAALEGK